MRQPAAYHQISLVEPSNPHAISVDNHTKRLWFGMVLQISGWAGMPIHRNARVDKRLMISR